MLFKNKFDSRKTFLTTVSALALLCTPAAGAADLSGRVIASNDNSGLEGATIRIEETNQRVSTSRDGEFRFPRLDAGTYTVVVRYIGADEVRQQVTVPAAGMSGLEIALNAAGDMENILVVGQRASMNSALSRQRASDSFKNFLTSDKAGNFPDQNIAEATRRIVGLSVENDQGEGRYVVIRGIDPNLNSTTINGMHLPSPDGGDRKVALDVIPSDLLEAVEVSKSATPDMDGNFIGGNIEVRTLSGFDNEDMLIKLKLEGSYNELEDTLNPKASLTFANQLSEKFAVAGSVSYFERKFGSHNKESGGGWDLDSAAAPIMEEMELRDYEITRRRFGAALNLDFRPSENTDLYIRTMYSNFEDEEYRNRAEIKFEDGDVVDALSDSDRTYFEGVEVDRELKDRFETQKVFSAIAGGESAFDDLTVTYSLGYSHAEEAEPDRLDIAFRQEGLNIGLDTSSSLVFPSLFFNGADQNAFTDLTAYELDGVEYIDGMTEDKEFSAKLDLRYDVDFGDYPGFIKAGVKYTDREKMRDVEFRAYDDFDGSVFDGMTLDSVSAPIEYDLEAAMGGFGVTQEWNATYLNDLQATPFDVEDSEFESAISDYDAKEDIFAGYLMASADIGKLRVIGGLRVERTDFETNAYQVVVDEDTGTQTVVGVSGENSYTDYLPSLNLRYEATDNVIIRAAYYASVVRPNIADLVPAGEVVFEDGEREAEQGNPLLDAYNADNFDFGIEWYPSGNAIVSAGVFYKDLESFIFTRTYEEVTRGGVFYDELTTPENGEGGEIKGFEFNVQTSLDMLPSPFNGIIVGANYTYTDSEGTVRDGDDNPYVTPLPKTSKNVANFILGYEKGRFEGRVAMSYRDGYLDELFSEGVGDVDGDRYIKSHVQWDIQASYEVIDGVKVYAEVSNLSNEPFHAVLRGANRDYLGQFEEYSWTGNFGVKAKF